MPAACARRFRLPRRCPLAACLAIVLGALSDAAPARTSSTIVVTSCLDSGPGSLRTAVASAGSGDTVDLTQLSCSQITLTSGRIATSAALTLRGPGSAKLTIDGDRTDRIFEEDAIVPLALYGMTLTNGSGFLEGGCIYSAGSLELHDVTVASCRVIGEAGALRYEGGGAFVQGDLFAESSAIVGNEVYSALGLAFGGGVSVHGNLVLSASTLSSNIAHIGLPVGSGVAGGGAFVLNACAADYSTISDNVAEGPQLRTEGVVTGIVGGRGGGALCGAGVEISYSTVSANMADYFGGLAIYGNSTISPFIIDSTISGNAATVTIGGVLASTPLTIASSTIAFNTEARSRGAGLYEIRYPVDLESTIIANNGGGTAPVDVGAGGVDGFTGANNLIMSSGGVAVPSDTIHADPHLLPLTDNGGLTRTHALPAGSVAIDAGNDVEGLPFDQRRAPFARTVGAPDIGAFEYSSDLIFANGFQ